MFSLAIVSLSPCSAAISSSTGATILHGPHPSAQKSTRTGLSLPRTSLAKLSSVTFTVLPAMGRTPCLARKVPVGEPARWSVYARGPGPGERSALVERLGQPALGVDRRRGAGPGRGDGLPVDVVDHVTAGEHAVDVGARGRVLDLDVAGVVELELPREQLAARVVPDRDEDAGDRQLLGVAADHVGEPDAGHGVLAEDVGDLLAQRPADLLVVLGALLHDLRRPQLLAAVHHGDALGEAGEEGGLLHRGVATAHDGDVLVAEEEAVTGRAGRHAAAEQPLLVV